MNVRDKSVDGASRSQPSESAGFVKPPKRGLRHVLGREQYLFKVELYLDGKVPTRVRKRILADLRNSIDADVEDATLREVLAGLGKPRDLAASFVEGADQSRPLWAAGAMAAIGTVAVYWLFLFTFTVGMLAVAMQAGGEFHSQFFVVEAVAFSGADGEGIGWTGNAALWFPLALAAIAFIPASRAWRVFGRR